MNLKFETDSPRHGSYDFVQQPLIVVQFCFVSLWCDQATTVHGGGRNRVSLSPIVLEKMVGHQLYKFRRMSCDSQ
jgi:hypothetical protein